MCILFRAGEVEILIFPTNSTANVGSSYSFTCAVSGVPLPQITWRRNGIPLSMEDYNVSESSLSNTSSYFAVSILTLCDLRLFDSDMYSCTASNNVTMGNVVSSFMLSVEGRCDQ